MAKDSGRELQERQEWARRADALRHDLFERYGVGIDSALLVRQDRIERELRMCGKRSRCKACRDLLKRLAPVRAEIARERKRVAVFRRERDLQ